MIDLIYYYAGRQAYQVHTKEKSELVLNVLVL